MRLFSTRFDSLVHGLHLTGAGEPGLPFRQRQRIAKYGLTVLTLIKYIELLLGKSGNNITPTALRGLIR